MVESVELASENAVVALRTTSPLCHAPPYFQMEIERVLSGVPGIVGVKCTFDHGGNWQPDNMTVGARRKLADHREFVRSRAEKGYKNLHVLEPAEVLSRPKTGLNFIVGSFRLYSTCGPINGDHPRSHLHPPVGQQTFPKCVQR
jgi:metal-sulfur cluster biosynthetic enzyme